MVMPLGSPQPTFSLPPLDKIEDGLEDHPEPGLQLNQIGALNLPALVFGGGAFSNQYNDDKHIASTIPLRTVRLALRYGIDTFDSSAYYGPSEIVLGAALKHLEKEFPRESYKLMTKCGRYGVNKENFDYSPRTIRKSVERSMQRLNTKYLDVVFLHDVEFVATPVLPNVSGKHVSALGGDAELYGLAEGQQGKIWGSGDQQVLDALSELRKMQSEGLIKHIGITGYPLPTLLRLAILILHTPPYKPLDVLLSYSHSNLQNFTFAEFAPAFRQRAHIAQLLAASPLNMGLLTPRPPAWHPAPPGLREATKRAEEACSSWKGGLANIALSYGIRWQSQGKGAGRIGEDAHEIPVVVGLSTPTEVHEAVRVWREVHVGEFGQRRAELEETVRKIYEESGFADWSWPSP